MDSIERIRINKNRGWRGLAEVLCENSKREVIHKMVFSFSQEVWDDMQKGLLVIQDTNSYIVLHFDNTDSLPKGQRSVLLKNFTGTILKQSAFTKDHWMTEVPHEYYRVIDNFKRNRNNHTTSDWNCIGVRVIPSI